jgi:hypothetical protein
MSDSHATSRYAWIWWIGGIAILLLIGAPVARTLVYMNSYYELVSSADDAPTVIDAYLAGSSHLTPNAILVTQDHGEGSLFIREEGGAYTVNLIGLSQPEPSETLRNAFRNAAVELGLEAAQEPRSNGLLLQLDNSPNVREQLVGLVNLTYQPQPNETWTFSWNGNQSMELPNDMRPIRHGPFGS